MKASASVRGVPRGSGGLGTFGGVFTPSILTILGLILFLRLGFVVGNAGLARAFAILGLATAIAVLTSSSLSAIATNRRVRGGGDYFLISRSLGVAYGGALGLLLFVAQSVSVAFYCLGFGEGIAAITTAVSAEQAALAATAVLLVLAWVGADVATKLQYVIMSALVASLLSFFVGGIATADAARLGSSWTAATGSPGFWALFAIFFPAVTGFSQGVSMSGDLRDASRSIPAGTFWAVGLSTVVYLAAILVLAAGASRSALLHDESVMRDVSAVPLAIDVGIIAATLSSALASFLGAPRILQALAADNIFPSLTPFVATHGPHRNPRRATMLTAAIAVATILGGSLDVVAAMVTMFFLISYGLLNYATYVEATAASPSFRPRFHYFHRHASLAGTGLAVAAMFAISPLAAAFAGVLMAAIYQYLSRTTIPAPWRDARRAYRFHRVKESLREVADDPEDPRDWQPHILAFTEGAERRERLLRFASWIAGGTGFTTAVQIVPGEVWSEATLAEREAAERELRGELERHELDAFPLAVVAADLRVAAGVLVQAWGVGPIRANTILVNWLGEQLPTGDGTAELWYARLLRSSLRLGRSVVVLKADADAWTALTDRSEADRRIDVWWSADDSARLSLLFAHLMTRTRGWEEATVRVLVPVVGKDPNGATATMERQLEEMRIDATVATVRPPGRRGLVEASRDAALLLLPLRLTGMRLRDPFDRPIADLLDALPVVALVGAAADVPLREEQEPDPGPEATASSRTTSDPAVGKDAAAEGGGRADGDRPAGCAGPP